MSDQHWFSNFVTSLSIIDCKYLVAHTVCDKFHERYIIEWIISIVRILSSWIGTLQFRKLVLISTLHLLDPDLDTVDWDPRETWCRLVPDSPKPHVRRWLSCNVQKGRNTYSRWALVGIQFCLTLPFSRPVSHNTPSTVPNRRLLLED